MKLADIISSLIALAAFIVSCASYWIAKKSLTLSLDQEKKKEPRFSLYLADNFFKDVNGGRLYVFSFTISNPADANNTITVCELKIIYKRDDKTIGNLILPHDKNLINMLGKNSFSAIDTPCNIDAHGAVTGITIFKLDGDLINQLSSERYEVIFRDVHDLESKKDVFIVKSIT